MTFGEVFSAVLALALMRAFRALGVQVALEMKGIGKVAL